ncbi:MAG: hypothetical protein KDK78_08265 [Chlamydiia bacterium]|nr:hypothetical protein [Chlamydiia bacterium]
MELEIIDFAEPYYPEDWEVPATRAEVAREAVPPSDPPAELYFERACQQMFQLFYCWLTMGRMG